MKMLTVTEAQTQLGQIIAAVHQGERIVLADGDKLVKLQRYDPADPRVDFDLEEDSPELEAELLKSIGGPYTPYARQDLEAVAERVRREMEKK